MNLVEVANFSLVDHHEKVGDYMMQLVRIEESFVQKGNQSSVFFLKITTKYCGYDHQMSFITSVRVPNNNDYCFESTGLIPFSEEDNTWLSIHDPIPERQPIIDVLLNYNNSSNNQNLELVGVLHSAECVHRDCSEFFLNLLIHDPDKSITSVMEALVIKHGIDDFMETTGLKMLSQSYPLPTWISLDLISQTGRVFRDDDFKYLSPVHRHDGRTIDRFIKLANDLGFDGIRDWLKAYLSTCITNDINDRVLIDVAKALGMFIPYIGGLDYAHLLLPPLLKLCTIENCDVRDEAVESMRVIAREMKEIDFLVYFVPSVRSLAASQLYTARVSSCGLLDITYARAPDNLKSEISFLYSKMCHDSMHLVRRSAALNIGKFAAAIEPKADIIPMLNTLTEDGV